MNCIAIFATFKLKVDGDLKSRDTNQRWQNTKSIQR